jgi:hypothetical protein
VGSFGHRANGYTLSRERRVFLLRFDFDELAPLVGFGVVLDRFSRVAASYNVSGAMSAPFGQQTVPASMKKRRKNWASWSGSKTGPSNH